MKEEVPTANEALEAAENMPEQDIKDFYKELVDNINDMKDQLMTHGKIKVKDNWHGLQLVRTLTAARNEFEKYIYKGETK